MVDVRCFGISTRIVCTLPEDTADKELSGVSFSKRVLHLEDMVCERHYDRKEKQLMVRCRQPKLLTKFQSNRDDWMCVGDNGLVTCSGKKTGKRISGLGMKFKTKEGFIPKYL